MQNRTHTAPENARPLHGLLQRQLARHLDTASGIPEGMLPFLEAVNESYYGFEEDRNVLGQSLEARAREVVRSNSEVRALSEAIPEAILRLDVRGAVLQVKPAASGDLLFCTPASVGSRLRDLAPAEVAASLEAAVAESIRMRQMVRVEYAIPRQPRESHYEARFVPISDSESIAVIRSITEQKHLEEQLRHSQKMDAFGQLAGGVAHDFNNLLTVIQGSISLMELAGGEASEHAAAIHQITQAANRAGSLTRQLLTFSRRQNLRLEEVDVNLVIAEITRLLKRLIGEDIALETRFANGGIRTFADPGMIEQIVMNLAVNSRDAMPRGGRIQISTGEFELDHERIDGNRTLAPGIYVRLSVADTGCGIPPEVLPRIFEPFFTTKDVGRGTGLGLATVFSIVEQHKGWIEVESEVDRGTTFHVYLPCLGRTPTPKAAAPAAEQSATVGNETVLLVEDEVSVRLVVQMALRRKGYRVFPAESGTAALRIWERHGRDIDLVITDMVMPGELDGRTLSRRLREDRPDLKIILTSGYSRDRRGLTEAIAEGNLFLAKPYDAEALLSAIRACLESGQPAQPAT